MPLPDSSATADPGALPDDPSRTAVVTRLVAALGDSGALDRLCRLAARLLRVEHAQVSLIGDEQYVAGLNTALLPAQRSGSAAGSLCSVVVVADAPVVVVDARKDPVLAGLPPVRGGLAVAYLGVPLRTARGEVFGSLCAYDSTPRVWTGDDVDVLGELAGSVVAELELRALSRDAARDGARLRLALDAADIGSFDLDSGTGELLWDDRLIRMFGYEPDGFDGRLSGFTARVHPEDRERVAASLTTALETLGDLSVGYRIVLPDGRVRWIEARGRVSPGPRAAAPRLLGVAYDDTDQREANDGLVRVLESMNEAFYALDADWRFTYVNREAERLLRRPREELLGRLVWEQFPELLGTVFQQEYERAVLTGEPVTFETPFDPLAGWFVVTARSGPGGLSVYFRETTGRHRAEHERELADTARQAAVLERERAEAVAGAATSRLELLAEASTRLGESLEPRQVLDRLGSVVVPGLARWLVVGLTAGTRAQQLGREAPAEDGSVVVVHVAHRDPARRQVLLRLLDRIRIRDTDPAGLGAVVRTRRAEWLSDLPGQAGGGLLPGVLPDEADDDVRALAPASTLTLPLLSRGRVLGAMCVAEPAGGPLDRALLSDLAGRAAVALDNALLYGAERRTGLTLQHSLLPRDLPEVPGMLSAARYLPGATGAFVGGDWYQGVRVGSGLVVAIGDVMGHGMRSAARMGQLRAIVATLALEGHPPGRLLDRLAESVEVLLDLELATLLVAAYDPGSRRLTVASAGHPPPLLAPVAGEPRFVDVAPGPPLGSFATTYAEVTVDVGPGDSLVLYTDGLIEDRAESIDTGLERLRSALVNVRLPPEAVCDHLLDALGRRGGGDDDVALLVLNHAPDPEVP